jgi:ABC-type iron transport system FetAB ATPase subunit
MNDLQVSDLLFQNRGPYTFRIAPGRVTGLQGASGAGKTLLLRAIADLDPHQGQVRLGDMAREQVPAPIWRKTVAMLPAESFWWFDVLGDHFKVPGQDIEPMLQMLGFELDVLSWEVSRMSTGEKQRLAIARLLQNKPCGLLLDEPTASLDAANIERTETMLLDYCRRRQVPVLWVSHDPLQLERVADDQFYFKGDGTLQKVRGAQHGR